MVDPAAADHQRAETNFTPDISRTTGQVAEHRRTLVNNVASGVHAPAAVAAIRENIIGIKGDGTCPHVEIRRRQLKDTARPAKDQILITHKIVIRPRADGNVGTDTVIKDAVTVKSESPFPGEFVLSADIDNI